LAEEPADRFTSVFWFLAGGPAFITADVANWLKKLLVSPASDPTNWPGCRACRTNRSLPVTWPALSARWVAPAIVPNPPPEPAPRAPPAPPRDAALPEKLLAAGEKLLPMERLPKEPVDWARAPFARAQTEAAVTSTVETRRPGVGYRRTHARFRMVSLISDLGGFRDPRNRTVRAAGYDHTTMKRRRCRVSPQRPRLTP